MMMRSWIKKGAVGIAILISATIHTLTLLGSGLVWVIIYLPIAQVEYKRFASPTDDYEAVVTYSKIYHVIPAMPGQGSDMSGTISIYDRDGNFYGSGSLDFVRDGYELEWTETGATLDFVGEWDFEAGTFSYWSEDGNRRIVEQVRR
ncbi:MAG: hypothetical protein ACFB14_09705 [Leptolyngbyaceae cyanobacterium]